MTFLRRIGALACAAIIGLLVIGTIAPETASAHERRDVWLRFSRWLVAGLTFLHFLLPLLAALVGLAWVAAVSVVMFVAGGAQRSRARHTR